MRALALVAKTFWSPSEAFAEIAADRIRPWAPLFVLIAMAVVSTAVFLGTVDLGQLAINQTQQSGQMQTMDEEQRANVEAFAENPIFSVFIMATAVLGSPVLIAIAAALYLGIFAVLGGRPDYGRTFSLTAFAFLPMAIGSVVFLLLVLLTPSGQFDPNSMAGVSPAVFLDPARVPAPLYELARALNLVTLWVLVLLAMAYRHIAPPRMSTMSIAAAVATPWLILVLGRAGLAALAG